MTNDRDKIVIHIEGLGEYSVPVGSSAEELTHRVQDRIGVPIMAVAINNKLKDLSFTFTETCQVRLITLDTEPGLRVYRSSAAFLLIRAVREVFPNRKLVIRHSLSNGLFCEFLDYEPERHEVERLQQSMEELVRRDLPFIRKSIPREEACRIFEQQEQMDKVKLLRFRQKDIVHVYELDGWYEYSYGYMVPRTGMINNFRLLHYPPGIILQTPEVDRPYEIKPYIEQKKLAAVFKEAKDWADMLQTPHVAALNDLIANQQIDDLIRINEALHEK